MIVKFQYPCECPVPPLAQMLGLGADASPVEDDISPGAGLMALDVRLAQEVRCGKVWGQET